MVSVQEPATGKLRRVRYRPAYSCSIVRVSDVITTVETAKSAVTAEGNQFFECEIPANGTQKLQAFARFGYAESDRSMTTCNSLLPGIHHNSYNVNTFTKILTRQASPKVRKCSKAMIVKSLGCSGAPA